MKNKKTNQKNANFLDIKKYQKRYVVLNKKGIASSVIAATLLLGGAAGGISYLATRKTSGGSTPIQPASDKCVITFESNGGSLVEAKQVEKGKLLDLPSAPTKKVDSSSYEFLGWYTDSGLTTKFDESTPINKNMVLYAKWEIPITTEGLGYVLNDNEDGFEVYCSDIEKLPSIVKIPESYTDESGRTLPVLGIYFYEEKGDTVSANQFSYNKGFFRCSNLVEIELPDAITMIPTEAFQYCSKLKRIKLPNNLKSIDDYAFNYCYSLNDIHLPESLLSIGKYSFSDCTSLQKVILPDSLLQIGTCAFESCPEVKEIKIGKNLQTLSEKCFAYNYNLRKVAVSNGITNILCNAFLKSLDNYVENTEFILEDDYSEWQDIRKGDVIVSTAVKERLKSYDKIFSSKNENNQNASSQTPCLIKQSYSDESHADFKFQFVGYEEVANVKTPICAVNYKGSENSPTIPETASITLTDGTQKTLNVRKISQEAFKGTTITSITIPSFITSIGNNAFENTDSLTSVTIAQDSKIEYLPNNAFKNSKISKLNSDTDGELNIPDNIISLGSSVFYNCENIKKVIIPSKLTNIYFDDYEYEITSEDLIFNYYHPFNGCKIEEYVVSDDNPNFMSINKAIYKKKIEDGEAYPEKLLDCPIHNQQNPEELEEYQIDIPEGVKSVASTAFTNVEKYTYLENEYNYIVNLTVPSSLVELNDSLSRVSCLKSMDVDQNNECYEVETNVLYDKGKTELIKFFNYYAERTSYTAPETLKSIKSYAFYHSFNIDEINLNEGLEEISRFSFYQFSDGESIKNIKFPSTLKYISYYAFCDEDYNNVIDNNSTIYIDSLYILNNAYGNTYKTYPIFRQNPTVYISKDINESDIDSSFLENYEKTQTESGNYWQYTQKD